MRLSLSFWVIMLSASCIFAQSKDVRNGQRAVASLITYSKGEIKANGTAVFVGNNSELLASSTPFYGADSAVVIDNSGKAHAVRNIVGIDDLFDCVKVRVAPVKKIKPLLLSSSKVNIGDELYMLSYGVKKSGMIEPVKVLAVDSVYSLAYYTLDKPMKASMLSLPLLNSKGELVAVVQQAASGDTVQSYAVSAALASALVPGTKNYGKGYYAGMNIRTAMPDTKEEALSCMYMQAMMRDSLSWLNAIKDFQVAYPKSYEGYQSLAEYIAIYYRDMDRACKAWDKALELTENKAEVYFGKGKVLYEILLGGDTVSHSMLSCENALAQVDKALLLNRQSLYLEYKAGMLYAMRRYADAVECYEELSAAEMRSPDIFAKSSQCYVLLNDYDNATAMLDSAVACYSDKDKKAAPYILARAIVKISAENYRDAVFDLNAYERLSGGFLGADFYYMREQAELNCKMYQQALNDIETAIDLAPENLLYYIEKGMLCYRVKLVDEGVRTMEKACLLAPDAADTHYLLGLLYVQSGAECKAKESFEKAISLGHTDAAVQLGKLK